MIFFVNILKLDDGIYITTEKYYYTNILFYS